MDENTLNSIVRGLLQSEQLIIRRDEGGSNLSESQMKVCDAGKLTAVLKRQDSHYQRVYAALPWPRSGGNGSAFTLVIKTTPS